MTDPIAEALDAFVPAFDSSRGDWQAILKAASRPTALGPARRRVSVARARRRMPFAGRTVRVATALAVLAVATTLGVAWAAGAWTPEAPLALFEADPQGTELAGVGAGPRNPWHQTVIPDSVKQVASVSIPKVGPVVLWHADTKQGGWCAGLRLSDGDWLGTGESPVDGGGSIPGCFRPSVLARYSDHLEELENDIDAHSVGGTFWRIRSGLITAPGAVKVTDLTTGQSTDVVDGDLFVLAIEAPNPTIAPNDGGVMLHLVAYDKAGNVVANDCPRDWRHERNDWPQCSGG